MTQRRRYVVQAISTDRSRPRWIVWDRSKGEWAHGVELRKTDAQQIADELEASRTDE